MPGAPSGIATIPGRRSLAQLQRSVASYVQAPDDPECLDAAQVGINHGIDTLNRLTWYKALGYQDITLVVDDGAYELNEDVKDSRSLELLNSSSKPAGRLDFITFKSLLVEYPEATASGSPCVYTVDYTSRLLLFDVTPTQAFVTAYPTVRLHYFRRFPRLLEEADTFDGPSEFEEFLVWKGREEIAAVRRPSAMGYAAQRWREILRQLRSDDCNTQTDWGA